MCVFETLTEHAIARVEEDGKADGHALVGKLRDGLCLSVFENLERVAPQVGHQVSLVVAYRRRNARDLYARPKEAVVAKDLILAADRRAGEEHRKKETQTEPNTHLAILPLTSLRRRAFQRRLCSESSSADEGSRAAGCRLRLRKQRRISTWRLEPAQITRRCSRPSCRTDSRSSMDTRCAPSCRRSVPCPIGRGLRRVGTISISTPTWLMADGTSAAGTRCTRQPPAAR